MNLYEIKFSHTAPKDSKEGIISYLLAENDEQVYEWIASEPKIREYDLFNSWEEINEEWEDEGRKEDIYDDDYNIIGTETFREKMIRIKGEMNDEDYDFSDAYYGITLYGWKLVKENINESDFKKSIEIGIISKI